ncbi:MAG TPA: zinc-binding alcohol dehydrogenase family protein [Steroidobacteraceae bacterium]|nr:zinc-binding alcohol dehydrogenase family protein [Steroidobacteraceae bacterium]
MKAALVVEPGQTPVYRDFPEPVPAPGKVIIRVTAAALSHVTRSRASGTHYSSHGELPFVAGVDGTGVTQAGQRVYFFFPQHPHGGMAELTLADEQHCVALPKDLDEKLAAAIAIPGISSWAALLERAQLRAGETVLINGATGTSGRLAIQIAKHLGAGKVIATGRRPSDYLRALGADVIVQLVEDRDVLEQAFKEVFEERVDIVLDYLWGSSAETLIVAAAKAGPEGVPIRYVEIGSISGPDITLPSAALRSSSLQLMGSGLSSVPLPRLLAAIEGVLNAAPAAGLAAAIKLEPLANISQAWAEETGARIVLVP